MPEPTVITPPVGYAVTLAEAKTYIGLEPSFTDHDVLIEDTLIPAASDTAEEYMWRKIIRQVWGLVFYEFPEAGCQLSLSPDARKPAEIIYIDTDGNPQTLADDIFEIIEGRLRLAEFKDWPGIESESAISITYERGWPEGEVPVAVKSAMLSLIYRQYETRCAEPGEGFYCTLSPYRLFEV